MIDGLTGDMRGLSELLSHLGIDGDHHIAFALDKFIACSYLLSYPVAEGGTDHSCTHVHDPLLGHLLEIRMIRQVVQDVPLLHREVADVLQRQVLITRHVDSLDLVVGQVPLSCVDDVLEEVDCHVVDRRQVNVVVHG